MNRCDILSLNVLRNDGTSFAVVTPLQHLCQEHYEKEMAELNRHMRTQEDHIHLHQLRAASWCFCVAPGHHLIVAEFGKWEDLLLLSQLQGHLRTS